jgi:L-lactate dehydrogenase complex protein LldG
VKKDEVRIADVGLTGCDALVARTGSVVLSSKENLSRTLSIFPPVHVVVAYRGSVVYDLKNYFSALNTIDIQSLPSMISIVSGPSRTADIEKTLVLGAHGPKEIHVFYIDQEKRF